MMVTVRQYSKEPVSDCFDTRGDLKMGSSTQQQLTTEEKSEQLQKMGGEDFSICFNRVFSRIVYTDSFRHFTITIFINLHSRKPSQKKINFFRALPKLPLPPPTIRASCTTFFGRQEQRLGKPSLKTKKIFCEITS